MGKCMIDTILKYSMSKLYSFFKQTLCELAKKFQAYCKNKMLVWVQYHNYFI